MSEAIDAGQTVSGTSLKALGGGTLGIALLVAAYSAINGNLVTAGAVLLYVPVGALLYLIGEHPERT